MPLWEVFHTAASFAEPQAKAWLAGNLTAFYVAAGLPAFYVNVLFKLVPGEDLWIGGKPATAVEGAPAPLERPFVRFSVAHIAIHRDANVTAQVDMCNRIDEVLEPHVEGYDWEYHIVEPSMNEWRINGFIPPPHGSPGEMLWNTTGRPVPYQ